MAHVITGRISQAKLTARAHVLASLLAGFGLVACGDDPAVHSLFAERPNAVVHAGGDAANSDTTTPDDTSVPDTDSADTTDTRDAADTQDADTTSDTTHDTTPDTTHDTTPDTDTDPGDTTQGGPVLALKSTIALPWVRAGAGGSELLLELENVGDPGRFSATLTGDPRLHLDAYDDDISDFARLTLRFDGSASEFTAEATLRISDDSGTHQATVWAVAGNTLPAATWTDLTTGPIKYGHTATVRLTSAPFPDISAGYTDDRVNVFVPDGYIDRGPVPMVVHFHGHGTTIADTLPAHKYREQLWASGVNAILVTPQGPVNAASGNFGKLMDAGNLAIMLSDVVAILYRDQLVKTPKVGDLVLTEHSGGYQAVALNLDAQTDEGQVMAVHLFDGLYGYSSAYEDFARSGGYFRSGYTSAGGTRANNLALVDDLGAAVVEYATAESLRDEPAVIWFTPAGHSDSTWWEQAYSETLRWGSTNARRGPRIELRTATVANGTATATWLAPEDDWTTAHVVETSSDGVFWTLAAHVDPSLGRATFALPAGRRVRVVPEVEDLDPADALPSDSYWLEGSQVLLVDGFDRILGGSWLDLRHDFMGRVGRAAKASACSNEAVLEGEIDLGDYAAVIWLVGDESLADHTFTAPEQALINAYLAGGGRIVISGSEVAYDLKSNGAAFLSGLGAVYQADDANQSTAKGAGTLAALSSFGFGGATAPYIEDYPDVLGTATGGSIALQYGNGSTAAAGKANRSVVVGFPLEVIDDDARLAEVVTALLGFVGRPP